MAPSARRHVRAFEINLDLLDTLKTRAGRVDDQIGTLHEVRVDVLKVSGKSAQVVGDRLDVRLEVRPLSMPRATEVGSLRGRVRERALHLVDLDFRLAEYLSEPPYGLRV